MENDHEYKVRQHLKAQFRDEILDPIRAQVATWRDTTVGCIERAENPAQIKKNGVLSARSHAFQQVLDLLDGKKD